MAAKKTKSARRTKKLALFTAACIMVLAVLVWLVLGKNVAVFNAAGTIADQERGLFIFASLLSLLVVIPVFALTFHIAWKYRAGNKKAKYQPDFDSHVGMEALWWGIPLALIVVLSVVTWVSSHKLDPFKPLASDAKPLEIQVIALEWKWLFIYPEQDIAAVNYVQFPEDRPVNFTITSDAPMNSFWIPQLGGQIYAMTGMSTKLHLMADKPGTYRGSSANLSGEGFSDMVFTAKSTTKDDFDAWVRKAKESKDQLDTAMYETLSKPTKDNPVAYYAPVQPGLYDDVVHSFMTHSAEQRENQHNEHQHTEH